MIQNKYFNYSSPALPPTPKAFAFRNELKNNTEMSICHTRSLFWLEELPLEIIPQLALQMDPWSLRALLEASPMIRSLCITLVGDRRGWKCSPQMQMRQSCWFPQFFDIPGLRHQHRSAFDPLVAKAVLKIYELSGMDLRPHWLKPGIRDGQHMNSNDSYVLCIGNDSDGDYSVTRWAKSSLWDKNIVLWRSPLPLHVSTPNRALGNQIAESMKQLELTCATDIHDLDLDSLESLTVVFKDPTDGTRPRFSDIKAPRLQEISLFYGNSPPVVESIRLRSTAHAWNTLTLCHIPSQRCDLSGPLPVYPSPIEDLDFSALCNDGSFTSVTVIGGHDNVVKQLLLGSTTSFCWRQTCRQMDTPVEKLSHSPVLKSLTFESLLPDAVVPRHDSRNIEKLCILGHDGLMMDMPMYCEYTHLRCLMVHCNGERENRAMPSLATLTPVVRAAASSCMRQISLHGLSVPPTGTYLATDELVLDLLRGGSFRNSNGVLSGGW